MTNSSYKSTLYYGAMGSGKTVSACMDIYDFLPQSKGVVFLYDPYKGGYQPEEHLSCKHVINFSDKKSEVDFFNMCEEWIDLAPESLSNNLKINRLIDTKEVPTIIYIEEFHAIGDKSRVSELIKKASGKNIHFALVSQDITNPLFGKFDLSVIAKKVFRTKINSTYLIGHDLASDIPLLQFGLHYTENDRSRKTTTYIEKDTTTLNLRNLNDPEVIQIINKL